MHELLITKPTELLRDTGSDIGYLHHHSIRTVAVASHPKAKAAPAHAATARSGQYLRGSPVVRDVQTFAASLCKMSDTGPVVYVWDKKNPYLSGWYDSNHLALTILAATLPAHADGRVLRMGI